MNRNLPLALPTSSPRPTRAVPWPHFSLLLLGLLSGAQAASWRSSSDAQVLGTVQQLETSMQQSQNHGCIPHAVLPGSPGVVLAGGRDLNEQIRFYEKLLKEARPGDPSRATYEYLLKLLREQKEKGALPLPTPGQAGSLSVAGALENAQKFLQNKEKAGMAEFAGSPEAKDAQLARAAARSLLAEGQPTAALAALLSAARLEPKNAGTLLSVAGLMVPLGMPYEASVLLEQAEKLGVGSHSVGGVSNLAVLHNNRGAALLGLGRWSQAEIALRKALALAPELAEGHTNLAKALLCQGRVSEAARSAWTGMRRTPSPQTEPDLPLEEVPSSPPRSGVALKSPEEAPVRRPARVIFDLRGGKASHLPQFFFPQTPEEAVMAAEEYRTRLKTHEIEYIAHSAHLDTLRTEEDKARGQVRPWPAHCGPTGSGKPRWGRSSRRSFGRSTRPPGRAITRCGTPSPASPKPGSSGLSASHPSSRV